MCVAWGRVSGAWTGRTQCSCAGQAPATPLACKVLVLVVLLFLLGFGLLGVFFNTAFWQRCGIAMSV